MPRRIVVTAALPYANGDIHIGHLLEYLQTDFWVRFQKMRLNECIYICADDTHGTPIMISAKQKGISPEELINEARKAHLEDFKAFEIEFDHYGSTNSEENRKLSEMFFEKLKKSKHIKSKTISQTYCDTDKIFLPDRYIRGECPRCGALNQYGDSCDNCSATYSATEVLNAKCILCHNTPTQRKTVHLFFKLEHFHDFLKEWVKNHTQKEIANKLDEWLSMPLKDWDISRDEPYFGFKIPGYTNKYFYVWLDAPIGYISSLKEWCDLHGTTLDEYWNNENVEIYHFIGKDITYFHTLFWPAMLKGASLRTPNSVFVHGFLKVNGEKMSKSKGTFINAKTFRTFINPLHLRFYYACKMSSSIEDIDLNLSDFVQRVNSELVGKITNLASRSFHLLNRYFENTLGNINEEDKKLYEKHMASISVIENFYEKRDFSKAMIEIRKIADASNQYFDTHEPWKLIEKDKNKTHEILTTSINFFRLISIFLKPILPSYASKVENIFNEVFDWSSTQKIIENKKLNKFFHLTERIDPISIQNMLNFNKGKEKMTEKLSQIDISDFSKLDLRVGKIISAEDVVNADKLIKMNVDIGNKIVCIFAGIKPFYKPEEIVGKSIVVLANLKPRKMKFGISEAMILAASDDTTLKLLTVDKGAIAGQKIS